MIALLFVFGSIFVLMAFRVLAASNDRLK